NGASSRYIALVPAAGSGSRMGNTQPKQYLPLLGRPLLYHSLAALCACPRISRVHVVLAADDAGWNEHEWQSLGDKLQPLFCGGATRADSVLNGLRSIADSTGADDWILVHDAARPCLASWHVDALIDNIGHDEVGG